MERMIIVMILVVMLASILLIAGMAMAQEPQPTYTPAAFDPRDIVTVYRPYHYHMPVVFVEGG